MPEQNFSLHKAILKNYEGKGRASLLPALHDVQEIYGYLPEEVASSIANTLKVPLADVFGVIEFYALFYDQRVSKTVVHVCNDPVCAMAGAETIFKRTTQKVELNFSGGFQERTVTIERAPCLGLCEHAPTMLVEGIPQVQTASMTLEQVIAGEGKSPEPIIGGDYSIITQNCGCGETTWLEDYESMGGYQALRKALNMKPAEIIEEVKKSGLVGRGGAAFPTGIKWEGTANAAGDTKYIVCNADEAEPGTFKDRVLMEDVPHRILEGIIIGAYAIGAAVGYVYIRGEYRNQYEIIANAVQEAYDAGYLGKNILGSGFSFEIKLHRGAGAYVCGEETAQFESIEGKRGFPRVKPPFPTTNGLFDKPTVINNVETFCNIPFIIQNSAAQYRKIGTDKSPGTKLFCVSGDVERPGLYEVAFGTSFRHLLEDLAGGMRNGNQFHAALFGGAAGAFATIEQLDVKLTFEDLRAAGLALGAGAIIIFDENRDLRDILERLGHFFADESCGKCYPCQIGTQRQYEILQRIAGKNTLPGDAERLKDIGIAMTDSSLCGLGQTASMAVISALNKWPELFQA